MKDMKVEKVLHTTSGCKKFNDPTPADERNWILVDELSRSIKGKEEKISIYIEEEPDDITIEICY